MELGVSTLFCLSRPLEGAMEELKRLLEMETKNREG